MTRKVKGMKDLCGVRDHDKCESDRLVLSHSFVPAVDGEEAATSKEAGCCLLI